MKKKNIKEKPNFEQTLFNGIENVASMLNKPQTKREQDLRKSKKEEIEKQ